MDGTRAAELVYEAPGLQKPASVSPNGEILLLNSEETERNALLATSGPERSGGFARARST